MSKNQNCTFLIDDVTNLTTNMKIVTPLQTERLEALEYDQEGISFQCDKKSCRQGQLIQLTGHIELYEKKIEFIALGKINTVVAVQDDQVQAHIHFTQYKKDIWDAYLDLLKRKQMGLDNLFKAVRGEE